MSPSHSLICRLCVDTCTDFRRLYDDSGQGNELYEMAREYFHPKIVDLEKATHLNVVCLRCIGHVYDFHHFQKSVIVAQVKLINNSREVTQNPEVPSVYKVPIDPLGIKVEQEFIVPEETLETVVVDGGSEDTNKTCSADLQLPKLEIMDVNTDSDCSSDDATPWSKNVDTSDSDQREHNTKGDMSLAAAGMDHVQLDALVAKWISNINCVACPASYPVLSLLEEHFRQTHPKEDFYILCCFRRWTSRSQIKEHLLLHNDPNSFKCDLCGQSYETIRGLRFHMKTLHPQNRKVKCSICHKGFDMEKDLEMHYNLIHNTELQPKGVVLADGRTEYTCHKCGKMFYTAATFKRHIYNIHRRKSKHDCTICGKSWKTTRELREHVAYHQKKDIYACAFCPQSFRKLTYAIRHRRSEHPQESNKNFYNKMCESPTEPTKREVDHCSESDSDSGGPSTSANLKEAGDSPTADESVSLDDLLAKWLPSIKCVACPESYAQLSLLEDHFAKQHPSEEFYITCCSRKLRKRCRIKDHLLLHNDPEAFKCETCDRTYGTSRGLREHMTVIHTENLKFPCKLCGKCFIMERGLKLHYTLVHNTGPRGRLPPPLQASSQRVHNCQECGKSFDRYRGLEEHVASHLDKDLYSCAFCAKTFRRISTVAAHRKKHHPHESNKHFYLKISENITVRSEVGSESGVQGIATVVSSEGNKSQTADGHVSAHGENGKEADLQ